MPCLAHSCHELGILSPHGAEGSRVGAAAGMGGSGQRKLCGGIACSWFCTYRDQLMMFPITKSTIRSCEGRQEG